MSTPEIKRLLAWFVAKCEGDSGTGSSYWDQFPEFSRAKQICADTSAPLLLPVEIKEEQLATIAKMRSEIAQITCGKIVGFCLSALAFEASVIEGNHDVHPALFDEWLHYWRSRIPEAKRQAAINRSRN
jgi:hypothetical protein